VRKQYHFRQSPDGLLAWDVDRLVALARNLPVEWVDLAAIRELDEPYWSGINGASLTCREVVEHARLMIECDLSYPIILSSEGRVMDGMHRVGEALLQGRERIRAVRLPSDPPPDFVGLSPDELPYS
jgi:hypothetical protein